MKDFFFQTHTRKTRFKKKETSVFAKKLKKKMKMKILLLIISFVLCILSSSSTARRIVASESWAAAFDGIHDTFKNDEAITERIKHLMEPVINGQAVPYADAFCSTPSFIQCVPTSVTSSYIKGNSQSPSWRLDITLEDLEWTAEKVENIQWHRLPKVVTRLNFVGCLSNPNITSSGVTPSRSELDIGKIMSRTPKSVKIFNFTNCGAGATSSVVEKAKYGSSRLVVSEKIEALRSTFNKPNHHRKNKYDQEDYEIVSLYLQKSTIDGSVLDPQNSIEWISQYGISELDIVGCNVDPPADSVHLPELIAKMAYHISNLKISDNDAEIQFDKLLQGLNPKILKELRIDLLDERILLLNSHNGEEFDEEKISMQLSNLAAVDKLHFGNLPFTKIPALPNSVKELSLVFAEISGEFPNLAPFYNLVSVDFTGNEIDHVMFDSIPPNLKKINLAGNALSGSALLADLSKLPRHLIEFNVSGNLLSGTNTMDFSKLPPRMEVFDISFNQLTGPVQISGQLPSTIKKFCINDNKFTGRYDIAKLPLLSEKIAIGNNDWDSLMPPEY
jgi:hypothetical protein